MRVFAIYNIKGGVGKTATAVNLAYLSAQAGARTLIWDLDPQAAATFYFRVRPRIKGGARKLVRAKKRIERLLLATDFDGLDILPADFSHRNLDLELDSFGKPARRLKRMLTPLAKAYDHVYIDCAPGISLVSEAVFAAADALLVPTIPTTLSLRTLEQLGDHLGSEGPKNLRVRPFFSMVDRRRSTHRQIDAWEKQSPFPFFKTQIPYSSVVEKMGTQRAPVATYARGSDAAAAYTALWRESLAALGSWIGWVAMDLPPAEKSPETAGKRRSVREP